MQFPEDLLNAINLNRMLGRDEFDVNKPHAMAPLAEAADSEPASVVSPITPSCIHLPVDCGMDRIVDDGLFH
jgi:hypothetical protein